MQDTIKADNILIEEGTLLPEALRIETEPRVPGRRSERSAKPDGLSSSWPVKLKRPSSVLTGKRWYAGQSKILMGTDWIVSES